MVRVKEPPSALPVRKLRIDAEARADRVLPPHFLRRADVKRLRKLLTCDGPNVYVAVQSGPADSICLDDDDVVRLVRHSHLSLPSRASAECRMKLDKEVPGCFGDKDPVFAGQPLNESRAFGWLNSLRKREIGWQAASTQITEYLKSRNASDARIKEQLDRASKYLRPWLRD
jgi:hypothetical protein